MSSEELVYRSKAVVRHWEEEGRWKLGLDGGDGLCLPSDRSIGFNNLWLVASDCAAIVDELGSRHPAYVREIRDAANSICDGRFRLLGVPVQYPARIPWGADPLSGKHWPKRFHTRLKIFGAASGNGDVRYVWELNRHQFLVTLAKAYRLTGDESYASAALDLIEDWIRSNAFNIGVNWTSALEVAMRSLSWCKACELFEGSAALTVERRRLIVESLYRHGQYIENNLSLFFSPFNHLIAEATALFVLGSVLSRLKPGISWTDEGWNILERELSKQFHPDGGTVEQATGYHHFTLGFYLQAVLLRRQSGGAIPLGFWSLLERAFEFSLYVMRPDGSVPMIGDGDGGNAIGLSQNSVWDFRSLLAIGAVLFKRADFKKMAGAFPPDAAWLVGTRGWKVHEKLNTLEPRNKSQAFSRSGYFIMRTGWDREAHYLSFDCGPIAEGVRNDDIPSAAHGHADALSIEISAFGNPILVDPGFYTYNGDEKWHRYFRETAAHNTVVVDRQSQAEYRGRLKWSHGLRSTPYQWMTSTPFDYVEGVHDGYTRLSQPVVHCRSVAFVKPDYWLLRDDLSGEGQHQIDRFFHFAPMKVIVDPQNKITLAECRERCHLAILPFETEGVTVETSNGGPDPENGWLATGYGKTVSAPVVRYGIEGRVPVALHTLLVPFREELPKMEVTTVPVGLGDCVGEQCVIIRSKRKTDILLYSSGRKTVEFYKGWVTNGRIACLRLDEKDSVISCVILDGSIVENAGGVRLRARQRIPFIALYFEDSRPIIEVPEAVAIWTSLPTYRVIISKAETISVLQPPA